MAKLDWSWMEQHMPGVVAELREYRESGEGAHLDECWRRGVGDGEPGWFFAREGSVMVGTPFDVAVSPLLCGFAEVAYRERRSVLMLAPLANGQQVRRLNNREKNARGIIRGAN